MEEIGIQKWYALYTKPRHEKFVECEFLKKGIEAFTPKITFKRHWSDRIKLIEEPLFKGYCFAKFSLSNKLKIVMQKGVIDVVHFNDQYIPIPDSVIESLKILTANKIKLEPYPYLKIGQRVVVKRGPLKGVEGFIVEKRNNNSRIVISIDAINSSLQCVLDVDYIEPA